VRVLRWQTSVRNESDDWMLRLHHRPTTSLRRRGLSGSICVVVEVEKNIDSNDVKKESEK